MSPPPFSSGLGTGNGGVLPRVSKRYLISYNTFFQFDNKYYQQAFGTPMGSPISPILADLVLQDLEEEVLKKFSFSIQAYFQYVDDTFLIIPKNKIKEILKNFNSYHSRLNFTYESEIDNTLVFLNLLMIKNDDRTIDTNWHRKKRFQADI